MQEMKVLMSEVKKLWKEESECIDNKIDAVISLEKEKLALEHEKLSFGISSHIGSPFTYHKSSWEVVIHICV